MYICIFEWCMSYTVLSTCAYVYLQVCVFMNNYVVCARMCESMYVSDCVCMCLCMFE